MATGTATGQKIGEGHTINVDPGATISKGDVWEGAEMIGVYQADAVSGDSVAISIRGEYTLTKESGVAWSTGDRLYWDTTNDRLDATATNVPAGIASTDAASGDVLADVLLNQGSGG